MAMPPTNVSATDLFTKLLTSKPSTLVDFPRNDPESGAPLFEVALVIVSQADEMAINAGAEKTARKLMREDLPGKNETSLGYDELYKNAKAIELLFRACRHPEDISKPLFPSKAAISDALTGDEVAILLNHYFTFQSQESLVIGALSEVELEAWIKKIAEGGSSSQYFLNTLSWEALKGLLIALAVQSQNLPMGSNSSGLPPNEATAKE